jgi:cell division protease FtsH
MDCYSKTKDIIQNNLNILHKIAQRLLEKEVLDGSEIEKIVQEGAASGEAAL